MSIALQAILFFLGYLPGAIFLSAYWGRLSSDRDLPVVSSTVSGRAALALLFAILFNALWGALYARISPACTYLALSACSELPRIEYRYLLTLFAGQAKDNEQFQGAINWIAENRAILVEYFISLCTSCWLLGRVVHIVVRRLKIDMKFPSWRYASQWHYLLSGECIDFYERANNKPPRVTSSIDTICVATILTEIDKHPYLYFGKVQKYTTDSSGELETLILESCARTTIAELDKVPPDDGIMIDAHFFIIRYSEIRNISLNYYNKRDIRSHRRVAGLTESDLANTDDDVHD